MEYLTELVITAIGAIMLGVMGYGITLVKNYFNLDPDGKILMSLDLWKDKAVEWIVDKATEYGEDLDIPDTRWKWVNNALDWLIPEIPKLMQFFGIEKDALARDIEQLVKKKLHEITD